MNLPIEIINHIYTFVPPHSLSTIIKKEIQNHVKFNKILRRLEINNFSFTHDNFKIYSVSFQEYIFRKSFYVLSKLKYKNLEYGRILTTVERNKNILCVRAYNESILKTILN